MDDLSDIASGEVHFIPNENNGGGKIVNSYKVQNPVVVLIYSHYLREEYGDYLYGSPVGVAGEWIVHSSLYDVVFIPNAFFDLENISKAAKHTDVGYTSFNDRVIVAAPTIFLQYSINKSSVILDFCIFLSLRKGDNNEK
jgi:hypothetical protein